MVTTNFINKTTTHPNGSGHGTGCCAPKRPAHLQNASIITKHELEFFRSLARDNKDNAVAIRKTEVADNRAERSKLATERRLQMTAMDEDLRARGLLPGKGKAVLSKEEMMERERDMQRAENKLMEDYDEVKHMNQIMLYGQCVTVRDAQVLEKKAIRAERAEEDRRMDMAMELERLKALRMYEERELKRVEDRKKGAAIIRAQIQERDVARLRKKELKHQEQEAMLHHIEKMKVDDRAEALRKKEASKKLMEDVTLANAEQIHLKNKQREMELEEEQEIAEYIKDRDAREQQRQDEERRIKGEKEYEIARLRAQQEKVQDTRAEMDELRARRAQEEYERNWRLTEAEAARRRQVINSDIEFARRQQIAEKKELLAEQALLDKEEYERIIAVQRITEEAERQKFEREKEARRLHAESLSKQVSDVEENRRKSRRDFVEEGNKLQADRRDREATIEMLRQRKIGELEQLQVPKPYRQELLRTRNFEPLRPSVKK